MKKPETIVVVFDNISREEFFHRLEWPYLVRAWSQAIGWEPVSATTIRLDLAGIDGLNSIYVTRRPRGDKVFIVARDSERRLIQTGTWEWDGTDALAVCYRRVYVQELAELLRERLVDFCYNTFLREAA